MTVSRRDFIFRVGQVGGYSAAFATMQSLGLMAMSGQVPEPIRAAAGIGKGVKVVVLGSGIGGLVSAYELRKLGYDVIVLEARDRPGGRNWTARNGTAIEFVDGTKQIVKWQPGNYQNLGPARLPSTHWTMLEYVAELRVPMEVEVNTSRSAMMQNDKANGGKAMVMRKAVNDTRGHVSELLSKCVAHGALDTELSKEDRERMTAFLKIYGPLDSDGSYKGSDRAGYKTPPGVGHEQTVLDTPADMRTLLDENFWTYLMFEETWDWQATMMQPVGGMDAIPKAFAKSLGGIIHYSSPVTAIRKTSSGIAIEYTKGGSPKKVEAAFCVIALPFEMLKKIPNDLSPEFKRVVEGSKPTSFYKVAWESRRFWERDYNIYGGISYLSQAPNVVWYPSANLFSPSGILVGGYGDEESLPFGNLTTAQKFNASRASVERLHPGHGKELSNPIFCGWRHIPWNEGSWIKSYGGGPSGYDVVAEPDGPFFFAGDTMSRIPGWQEGAALSARRTVSMISEKVKAARVTSRSGILTT
jgi:monoamine oxidase